MLHHPRHGTDRARLPQALCNEHGQDQLARLEAGLGNHRPHGRSGPQPSRPLADGTCGLSLSKPGMLPFDRFRAHFFNRVGAH